MNDNMRPMEILAQDDPSSTGGAGFDVLETESSFEVTEMSTDTNTSTAREEERKFFQKARDCLSPGRFFRNIVYYYAERKVIVFFLIHLMSTLIVWAHFALIKFEQLAESVPDGASRYWWKRVAPALEFGSMHAILFQLALIPITMSRYSIAALSESFVDKIVPLNRSLQMHIHLGYTLVTIVFFATIFFFAFFGLLCVDGDETFCAKFTSEIMITGYVILASLLVIGGTSYCRHRIPYEVFYGIHHLVFIMYFVTIAHTLDVEQRSGTKNRSQTFAWFSSTLAFYFCDRAAMSINHWYEAKIQGSSIVTGSDGTKTILLRVRRPTLLRFRPGQYAFLRVRTIDIHWHPFSIASCPDSSELEFYIEVHGENTWTSNLCVLLESNGGSAMVVEVQGPYGTSIAKTGSYSHILAIGAGTGIVPILSLFRMHIRDLLRLEPQRFFAETTNRERKVRMMEIAEEQRKGSMVSRSCSVCKGDEAAHMQASRNQKLSASIRSSIDRHHTLVDSVEVKNNSKAMRIAASSATRSIYGVVLLSALPVVGMTLLGLTISWNTIPVDVPPLMVDILKVFTIFFQIIYAVISLFIWDGNGIFAFVDVVLCCVCSFADWYWFQICDRYGSLRPADILTYSILVLYMTGRLWARTVSPRHSTWQRAVSPAGSVSTVDKMDFVWTTSCASQVVGLLPDIVSQWDLLVSAWGVESASKVCKISIHVTDTDEKACRQLHREIRTTSLYRSGAIKFLRPDLERVIEDHSIDLICARSSSYSLLAFCGSPSLAQVVHKYKISNDMVVAITGNKRHQMDFVSESYGGSKKKMPSTGSKEARSHKESDPLTTRKSMRYSLPNRSSLQDLLALVQDDEEKLCTATPAGVTNQSSLLKKIHIHKE